MLNLNLCYLILLNLNHFQLTLLIFLNFNPFLSTHLIGILTFNQLFWKKNSAKKATKSPWGDHSWEFNDIFSKKKKRKRSAKIVVSICLFVHVCIFSPTKIAILRSTKMTFKHEETFLQSQSQNQVITTHVNWGIQILNEVGHH